MYYCIDKRAAYSTLAASMGIKTGDLHDVKEKKEYRKVVRRLKRQMRLVADDTIGSEKGSSWSERWQNRLDRYISWDTRYLSGYSFFSVFPYWLI